MRPVFVTSKTSEGKTGVLAKPAKADGDQVQVIRFMNLLKSLLRPRKLS